MTGSRMFRLGEAISILARSVRVPSGNSPARIRSNRSRFSSTLRSRYGLFLPGSVSVPRYSRVSLGGQVADVGLAGPDQLHGPLVELFEVVGGIEQPIFPVEPEPAHILLDRLDVLVLFLGRIRVVEAQIAQAAVLGRQAEVQADALGMPDVQVAVRFGWKPRVDTAVPLARCDVVFDDLLDEVQRTAGRGIRSDAASWPCEFGMTCRLVRLDLF